MNLDLSPDQRLIRDEAARFLSERSASVDVRRVVDAGSGADRDLWSSVSRELGWCALAVPEAYGGLGLGWTETTLLLELSGARLACIPLWSTLCLSVPLILSAGSEAAKETHLASIAAGETTVTVALPSIGQANPFAGTSVTARQADGVYLLDGTISAVPDVCIADLVLVPAALDNGTVAVFAVETSKLGVEPLVLLDATKSFSTIELTNVSMDAAARIDEAGVSGAVFEFVAAVAGLGLAAEQVGSARGAMDLTLAYVAERVQFGRKIASFQAIKHRCAKLEIDMAEARSLLYGAAAGVSLEDGRIDPLEVAGVRVLAGDLAFRAGEEAIQLHGGVGFTWEYDPHLYFKRAQAMAVLLGRPDEHLDIVAAAVIGGGA